MKIYKDIFNQDEVLSDTYPIKDIDDVVYEVEAKMISKTEPGEYNIGGNASAEAPSETYESTTAQVINVVDAHRLCETSFDKKAYMGYIKAYMKKVLDKLKADGSPRAEIFQKGVQPFIKKVLENFNDYAFYTGNSMDIEGLVILMAYKEDGITPYFYYFKDGLEEEKV